VFKPLPRLVAVSEVSSHFFVFGKKYTEPLPPLSSEKRRNFASNILISINFLGSTLPSSGVSCLASRIFASRDVSNPMIVRLSGDPSTRSLEEVPKF